MPSTLDESYYQDLIVRLKQGDKAAFSEIYRIYSKPLYLKVLRMVKDRDMADEIIQELFIRIWDNHPKIDETKSFRSYLYMIAQNLVYNHFRKLETENRLLQTLMNSGVQAPDVEALVENKEVSELLKKAIQQLSPQRKMAFTLCKLEGKSYKEVSEIMGVSVATINTHITQSMQIIKNFILQHRDLHILAITVYSTLNSQQWI